MDFLTDWLTNWLKELLIGGIMGNLEAVSYTHLDVYKRQFHTLRDHPFKVQDDKAMDDLVGTIKEHGIMTPATVRPEKDGKGYEIIAGHRRHHGGARAGLEEMPCIVREMTDLEAVREMRNSNKQRGDPLPSELAKLLDLEVEAIKRQGARCV